MRILHLKYKDGIGGAESVLISLAERAGDELEHHFIINTQGVLAERLFAHTLHVCAVPFTLAGALSVRSYVRERKIDIVHAHGARANLLAVVATMGRRTPIVTTEHSAGDVWRRRWTMNALDRYMGRRNARRIAVSGAARETLLRLRIVPDEKIDVIANGVDTERFAPGEVDENLRAELRANGKRLTVNVGRLASEKGQTDFIDAAAGILSRRDDARFAIVGDGPLRDELKQRIAATGLGERIRLLGARDDVADILRASDAFCLPSLWEGMPVSLLEAMASGLPCVASRVAGCAQVIDDGVTGRLVAPQSVDELTTAIEWTLDHPDEAAAMGARARESVVANYCIERMIDGYRRVYRDVLQGATR